MAPPARLIDLDGTLVDTFPHYAEAIEGASPHASGILQALLSGGNVIALMRAHGVTPANVGSALRRSTVRLVDGWSPTITELRLRGHPVGVVTSLPGWLTSAVIDAIGLRDQLDVIVTNARKPSASGLLTAFTALGLEPTNDDVYVGDTQVDEQAARACGIGFVWVSWGYGTSSARVLNRPEGLLDV